MKHRLKFECWNCNREFSLMLETEEEPVLISECPYCTKKLEINLASNREKLTRLFRGNDQNNITNPVNGAFKEVIQTTKPDNDDTSEQ